MGARNRSGATIRICSETQPQPARNLFGAMPASWMKAALTAANFVPIPLDDSIRGMVPGRHVRQPGDAIGSIPQKRSAPPRVAEPGMDGAGG